MHQMKGKIYGIGVGIGDPEDITLKAIKRIKESDVIVCPRQDLEKCRAYSIVKQAVPEVENIEKLFLEFEMTRDEEKKYQNHRRLYETVKEHVLEGKTVSFLTIGNPAVYSTFSYIAELAYKDGIEVRCVSGVSSITACANRLGIPLVEGNDQLHVLPQTDDIEDALNLPGTKVIMKSGKEISSIKELLRKRQGISVFAVSECGMAEEKCYFSVNDIPDDGKYMITIIVKENKDVV